MYTITQSEIEEACFPLVVKEKPAVEKIDATKLFTTLLFEYEELAADYGKAVRVAVKESRDPMEIIIDMIEHDPVSRRIMIEFNKYNLNVYDIDYSRVTPLLLAA